MQRLPNVHPSDTTKYPGGIGTFDVGAANTGSKILLYNLTPLNIDLDFLNGSTDVLHAWEANWWRLDGDTKQIEWIIDPDSLNVDVPPVDAVFMTLYQANENIPGTYPISLLYQSSVGNPGGTPSNVTSLQNTGNAPGTNVVSVGSTGAVGNTWTASNDGLWLLAVTIAAALVQVLKTNASDPILQLGALTHTVEVLGSLQVDQNLITNQGSVVHLVGGAGGTADLYTVMAGTGIKIYLIVLAGFKTGASDQNISFPKAFTKGSLLLMTDTAGFDLDAAGVKQNLQFMTTAQNGGSSTTIGQSWGIGQCTSAFDRINWAFNNSNTHSGFIALVGV